MLEKLRGNIGIVTHSDVRGVVLHNGVLLLLPGFWAEELVDECISDMIYTKFPPTAGGPGAAWQAAGRSTSLLSITGQNNYTKNKRHGNPHPFESRE